MRLATSQGRHRIVGGMQERRRLARTRICASGKIIAHQFRRPVTALFVIYRRWGLA
jgi:hypothetical protein